MRMSLSFVDLKLKPVNGKIHLDTFAKLTSTFAYVFPSSSYHKE